MLETAQGHATIRLRNEILIAKTLVLHVLKAMHHTDI